MGNAEDPNENIDAIDWVPPLPSEGHNDLWVLVCGGIAAVAAFAAAFLAAGGAVSHAATPASAVPAVVSQSCPAPSAARTPAP
jgi:hypothetical protein